MPTTGASYRRLAVWGVGAGTAVTVIGSALHIANDWSTDDALIGTIPTGLGTIPMALPNYLTQTTIGLATLGWLLDDIDLSRTMIAVWILGVWALQLWWSTWWLERFRYGPFEWAWRCATYRAWQPLRRAPTTTRT